MGNLYDISDFYIAVGKFCDILNLYSSIEKALLDPKLIYCVSVGKALWCY